MRFSLSLSHQFIIIIIILTRIYVLFMFLSSSIVNFIGSKFDKSAAASTKGLISFQIVVNFHFSDFCIYVYSVYGSNIFHFLPQIVILKLIREAVEERKNQNPCSSKLRMVKHFTWQKSIFLL